MGNKVGVLVGFEGARVDGSWTSRIFPAGVGATEGREVGVVGDDVGEFGE